MMMTTWSQTLYRDKWIEIGQLFSRKKFVSQISFEIRKNKTIFILGIYTEEQFRKLGFAKVLLKSLLNNYPKYKFELEILPFGQGEIMTHNQLKKFYKSFGFKKRSPIIYSRKRIQNKIK